MHIYIYIYLKYFNNHKTIICKTVIQIVTNIHNNSRYINSDFFTDYYIYSFTCKLLPGKVPTPSFQSKTLDASKLALF